MSLSLDKMKTIPLFSELSDSELEMLRHHLTVNEYLGGQTIFRLDDRAVSCFIISSGSVGVWLNDADDLEPVVTLESGSLVGQMALIDGKRRSATCRVNSTTAVLVELKRDDFDRLMAAQTSFAYKILDKLVLELVGRLRETNERLVAAHAERSRAGMEKKTREAAAHLLGGGSGTFDDLDPDSIQVMVPSLTQRMRERQDK